MGTDIASLGIRIESLEAQVAQQRLDGLTRSGGAAEQALNKLGSSSGVMGGALSSAHGHVMALAGSLAAIVGVTVSVAGGLALIKKGIEEINTFSLQAISTSAMMLSRSNVAGVGDQITAYKEYKSYVLNMYEALEAETQRHFASGNEMIAGFSAFAKKGIYAAQEEAAAVGVITDAVKLLHGGYVDQSMMLHEIQGVLEGHAGIHFKLAQTLKGIIGPEWKNIVQSHVQDGTLLTFLEEKFKGLGVASGDIQKTLTAQGTTLYTLAAQVGRGGLGGLYEDIVGVVSTINGYLREHKDSLISGIIQGWQSLKELAGGVYGFVSAIYTIVNTPITWAIQISTSIVGPGAKFLAGGAGPMGDYGFGALDTSVAQGTPDFMLNQAQQKADEVARYKAQTYQKYLEDQNKIPPWSPAAPDTKKDKGAAKQEAAEASVRKFIETMAQETAKGAGDTEAILTAWKNKQLQTLEELAAKGADITKAKEALNEAATSKQMKLDSDFTDWYIAGMGNQYEALVKQENKKLTEVTNNEVKTSQVHEVYARKKAELDDQVNSNTMNLFKGYLDTMAGLNPTLEGQLTLKRQALDLELKISDAALERQIREKQINTELADEARSMAAVVAQAKKFDLEMQNDKGLSGWAYGRVKADQQKNTWADAMGGLEDFVGNAWTQGIQGALSKTKVDYMEVAKTMAQSFILNLGKQGITWGFGQIAKGILGDKAGSLGTEMNPMVVKIKGMGLPGLGKGSETSFEHTVQKAGKIGYSTGGGGQGGDIWNFTDMYKKEKTFDKAFDADMKGWITGTKNLDKASNAYSDSMDDIIKQNQDAFKTEYITGYENSFTGMAGNITSVWGTAQGLMTAAGVQGESQRYATMAQYGIQGITLLYDIAAKGTLAKAWTAGASAYSSVWEFLGFPLAVAVAPVMAAIAFAGTLAAGSKSSAGGDYQVGMTGPRLVHQDETILPAWAAQSWRDIVSRENTGNRPGENGNQPPIVYSPTYNINAIDARGVEAVLSKHSKHIVKVIKREMGNRLNG